MTESLLKLMTDVRECCSNIRTIIRGKTLEDIKNDITIRSAVLYQFVIIGEALNKAWKIDSDLESQITDLQEIVDFRNHITHGYSLIDEEIVWAIIIDDLPKLEKEVEQLINKLEGTLR